MPEVHCPCCGETKDFENEESLTCVPPKDVLVFGRYHIEIDYREALYNEYPQYTVEEIVGSYIGENHLFPSYDDWIRKKNGDFDMDIESEEEGSGSDSDSDSDSD